MGSWHPGCAHTFREKEREAKGGTRTKRVALNGLLAPGLRVGRAARRRRGASRLCPQRNKTTGGSGALAACAQEESVQGEERGRQAQV